MAPYVYQIFFGACQKLIRADIALTLFIQHGTFTKAIDFCKDFCNSKLRQVKIQPYLYSMELLQLIALNQKLRQGKI